MSIGTAKRPSSAKQREASRSNGQKSQGPTSEQGKSKSRFNATKHGFTSEKADAFRDEQKARARKRFDQWAEQYRVQGPVQEFLLVQAVHASIRMEDIQEQLLNSQAYRVTHTEDEIEQQARRDAEDLILQLPKNGPSIGPRLRRTVAGCELIIERWMSMGDLLIDTEDGIVGCIDYWHDLRGQFRPLPQHSFQKINDFNQQAKIARTAEPTVRQLCRDLLVGNVDTPESFDDLRAGISHPGSSAMLDFTIQILEEIQKLEAEADVLEALEAPRRAKAIADAWIDTSREGALLNRYLKDAERSMSKNLDAIRKQQALEASFEAPSIGKRNEPGAPGFSTQPVAPRKLSESQIDQHMALMDQYLGMIGDDMDDCSEDFDEDEAYPEAPEALEPPPEPLE